MQNYNNPDSNIFHWKKGIRKKKLSEFGGAGSRPGLFILSPDFKSLYTPAVLCCSGGILLNLLMATSGLYTSFAFAAILVVIYLLLFYYLFLRCTVGEKINNPKSICYFYSSCQNTKCV